jgi:ATP-dependent Clp protease ATP-binding subunit ClpA
MFEHFAAAARAAVVDAHARARDERAARITEDHLLAALLAGPRAGRLLTAVGLDPEQVPGILADVAAARRRGGLGDADARALADLGIDLDQVVAAVERNLGADALAAAGPSAGRGRRRLTVSPGLREVLGTAVRRARALGDRELRAEHLLLAVVGRRDAAAEALAARGVTTATLLAALDRARGAA